MASALARVSSVARQKKLADRVFAGLRQGDAQFFGLLREKFVRNLDKNAAAVAKLRIGADGASVIQIEQDSQAHLDDVVAGRVVQIGDEADAAGIVLLGGIVKTLRLRKQGIATLHGRHLPREGRHDFDFLFAPYFRPSS